MSCRLSCPILAMLLLLNAGAAEHLVQDEAELLAAAARAKPGDHVVMKDGTWSDMPLVFLAKGSTDKPVVLRPQSPAGVVVTGTSSLKIGGEYIEVRGLVFRDGVRPKFTTRDRSHVYESDVIALHINGEHQARHTRLTRIRMNNWTSLATYRVRWIYVSGEHNRIDHCRFIGQADRGETIVVAVGDKAVHHRIDHNTFAKRPKGKMSNGYEVMRIGGGDVSMDTDSGVLVEYNVFDDCDGEGETISVKASGCTFRYNLFMDTRGELVLRNGNRCVVENNRFERCMGGIRISGSGHKVTNNLVVDSTLSGIRMVAGLPDTRPGREGYRYLPVVDCMIANNTIVNPGREGMLFGEWLKGTKSLTGVVRTSGGTILPTGNRIERNIVAANQGMLLRLRESEGNVISCNLLHAAGTAQVGEAGTDAKFAAPPFVDPAEGDYRLEEGSSVSDLGADAAHFEAGDGLVK
ncbi:MAG: hypothetical protein HN742_32160 [Lentisphaerae bacterium]|jgi:poly(beta-D-mannuronate) lyase|nr:hypothetical protein [Lentisphaerota bacterium]MBT5607108.1 hypothetical protein [Lentisphaerota bacterium]MBT7059219.1 hypothetical protein [Lentisphaerota bacterium]MBT7846568.1 hypothetical protein [Lentisphaerota bacterium]